MQLIAPNFDYEDTTPLYLQLYLYLRNAILTGGILPGEKLLSLRSMSKQLGVSVTTIDLAYNQLLTEGYIISKPQSGYYVCSIPSEPGKNRNTKHLIPKDCETAFGSLSYLDNTALEGTYYDSATFDFIKWKKCTNKILTDYSNFLLLEGDPRGEAPLRYEISKYIYQARGVRCTPEQIVIGAGTQQLTGLLCIILNRLGIEYVAFEEPGYVPIQDIFQTRGFKMSLVPVLKDGIQIEKLPANIKSVAYVSPSNQFPTGSIMPIGRRYALLDWASQNNSIIIEDDYNSELRYFGKAVPSLQGLDEEGRVIYLGSFSSTLFPSIKISYMVLPEPMLKLFEEVLGGYNQTCSKTEQMTLALYMEKGLYQTNIKKLRNLYSQKIQIATQSLKKYLKNQVKVLSNTSGLHMLLEVPLKSNQTIETLCAKAIKKRLPMTPVSANQIEKQNRKENALLIFYYTRVPLEELDSAIKSFSEILQQSSETTN
ncbi:MocR-like pyridoxine biosynthesis transcription factor PdxR [Anaerovorax sp. IOR16]|uniref:MocR-like pyridoxine biosynthesis transcription factor PdxR n=1 Tax=Anaerovorax sp. IOR16 TaxID=2773458 RepID=UPI0019CFEA0A|nr:PLP-dependent aminotransferase family protein [Anaerovorax sp. IOR16]